MNVTQGKFKKGERVFMYGPGWGSVRHLLTEEPKPMHHGKPVVVCFDAFPGVEFYFTEGGQYHIGWEPTLMTKDEADHGRDDIPLDPRDARDPVVRWLWAYKNGNRLEISRVLMSEDELNADAIVKSEWVKLEWSRTEFPE